MPPDYLTALARPFGFLQDRDDLFFRDIGSSASQSSSPLRGFGTVN